MDKYNAWISNIEPLTIGNEKSITQIMSELIPILLNVKGFQDEQNTLLNENFKSLNNSSTNFKESITTNTEMFDTLRDTETLNIKNIEDGYTAKISEEFSKMLNKLNNIPITQNEFNEGVYSVNYDLNNPNSAYSKWNREGDYYKAFTILKGWDEQVSGYWYNTGDKQVYYNDHIVDENKICYMYKYQDKLLFRDAEIELGEELFPHTENGYFIGFIDNNTACYYATSTSATETKHTIKTINLTTKEITTYENLILPDDFKSPYLQSNNHYVIKKYNDYYYMIYITNASNLPRIMKSSDLVHWGNVGSMSATGECTFKLINNKFYFVSINTGSWILNDDMSFTKVSPNSNNFIVLGMFLNKFYGVDVKEQNVYRSDNFDFSNSKIFGSINSPKDLTFYLDENYNGIVCGMPYCYVGGDYPRLSQVYLPYHGAVINNVVLYFDLLQAYANYHNPDKYYRDFKTIPLHKYQYGDFVITDDFKIYSDFNLQSVTIKTEVRSINT